MFRRPLLVPLLLLLVLALAGSARGDRPPRLDAWLQAALREPSPGRMVGARDPSREIQVLVQVTDGGKDLEAFQAAVGGRRTSAHGDVRVVRVPVHALEDLGRLPGVRHVEASLPLEPRLDLARSAEGVNRDALARARPDLTGRGVLVGIVDSGVDPSVQGTRDETGRTRILHYWEQREPQELRPPTVTLPEGGERTYPYGAEYLASDLDQGVIPDSNGFHGTHVAGIAAGRDPVYQGMAPEARLLVVANSIGDDFNLGAATGSTLDAYEYLLSRAAELGLPLVVNESQGHEYGPHDGSTLFEQALQADVDSPVRRLVACVAAGNTQRFPQHARVVLGPQGSGAARLDYGQGPNPQAQDAVDLWLTPNGSPTLTVNRYSDLDFTTLEGTSGPIPFGSSGDFDTGPGYGFTLAKELPSALNGHNHFVLAFRGQVVGDAAYEIVLSDAGGSGCTVDLYTARSFNRFVAGATSEGTLNLPGTTPGVITVGSYVSRTEMQNELGETTVFGEGPLGALAPYSSLGPPRAPGRYSGADAVKPDLAAPGATVISLRNQHGLNGSPAYVTPDGQHLAQSGTSMASPMVAGVVALMLQENPAATAPQIKEWLFAGCRSDEFTGAVPNGRFGHGKLDAAAALAAVASPTPRLDSATRGTLDLSTLVLSGANFAVSCQVLLDGVAVEASRVRWEDHRRVLVSGVPADPPILAVTVRNPRAPEGAREATLALNTLSAPALAPGNPSCFVATAAYGSPLEPRVQALRDFRDRWLLPHPPGRAFVAWYYRVSPPLAALVARHALLRGLVRAALEPVVSGLEHAGAGGLLALALLALLGKRKSRPLR